MKPLPPLRSLVIFEAAVRHASFKRAAAELHLTPGAVGQQIRKLEQWLGMDLFQRHTRQVIVTDQGIAYYRRVAPALAQIAEASDTLRHRSRHAVCLSLSPTLAAKWLAPRMADFVARHPTLDVHINATTQTVDFETDGVDLAIRHFDGKDPSLASTLLYPDEVRLLCTPAYRDRINLRSSDDLRRATLLHTTLHQSWEQWLLRFSDLGAEARQGLHGLHFDQTLLAIEAAKRGQGVVLSSELLARDELERCELIEPIKQRLPLAKGYYLVHPKQQVLGEAALALKEWLLAQFSLPAR